jgi:hypothetical protein
MKIDGVYSPGESPFDLLLQHRERLAFPILEKTSSGCAEHFKIGSLYCSALCPCRPFLKKERGGTEWNRRPRLSISPTDEISYPRVK